MESGQLMRKSWAQPAYWDATLWCTVHCAHQQSNEWLTYYYSASFELNATSKRALYLQNISEHFNVILNVV